MTPKAQLADAIRKSVNGPAWHGPSLVKAIEGISAAQAAAPPIAGAHSIWEILLHAAAWMDEIAERLGGACHREPLAGDWPSVPEATESNWGAAWQELANALSKLESATERFPEERLPDHPVPGVSFFETLAGAAQHNSYHAGQIMLLRKLAQAGATT
ncbi:MAG: DinB family protein [Acidobacteria bacterium]|nr:DinB family protein [Acidobacteriota bacterium]